MTPETCVPTPGFPIRRSSDRSLHTASRGLSQCATSFFGTWRQGIPRAPLVALTRDTEKLTLFNNHVQLLRFRLTPDALALRHSGSLATRVWSPSLSPTPGGSNPLKHYDPALRRAARTEGEHALLATIRFACVLLPSNALALAAQVEMRGLEPLTSALQRQRSPN
jgi:hypothetical protein